MMDLPSESDLQHGCNERGGETVAGNVGDEDAEMRVVDLNEVVKVPGDGGHREKARSNVKAWNLGNGMRQDGELNLPRHFEFVVQCKEPRRELRASLAKHDVAADASLHHGRRERFVDVIHGAYLKAAGFIFRTGLASQKDHRNLARAGIRL